MDLLISQKFMTVNCSEIPKSSRINFLNQIKKSVKTADSDTIQLLALMTQSLKSPHCKITPRYENERL